MLWILFFCLGFVKACDPDFQEWQPENSHFLRSLGWRPDQFWTSELYDDNYGMESLHLIGGDIIPDDEDDGLETLDRNVTPKKEKRWPGGKIPYVRDKSLDSQKDAISEAMKHIEDKTCIRFIKRSNEKNYVHLYKGSGCNSKVGMTGGRQDISLGDGCYKVGKIMHELMHAIGFYHEQSRSDRDQYITVYWQNIKPGYERNFEKLKPEKNLLLTTYDYDSITHYSETSFSKDKKNNLKTMKAKKKGVVLKSPGDKPLSALDIKRVAMMYKC